VIIPVIDIMCGEVVHAKAGRRDEYQPIQSGLTTSTDPIEVCQVLIDLCTPPFVYVADLDAIIHKFENLAPAVDRLARAIRSPLWIDAGLWHPAVPAWLHHYPHTVAVIGTETIRDWQAAISILDALGPERSVLSLDWIETFWGTGDSLDTWLGAWQRHGGRHVIWLDLAAVGVGGRSIEVVNWWAKYADLRHFAAGGIRDMIDVYECRSAGAAGCLVASALHDGRIGRIL
jgi:phosphoribosylformimino-5-aminoimidazole carboxamide ribotide isomerase